MRLRALTPVKPAELVGTALRGHEISEAAHRAFWLAELSHPEPCTKAGPSAYDLVSG